jgi:hypothetical protein
MQARLIFRNAVKRRVAELNYCAARLTTIQAKDGNYSVGTNPASENHCSSSARRLEDKLAHSATLLYSVVPIA